MTRYRVLNGPGRCTGVILTASLLLVAASAGATDWHVPDDPGAATVAEALASAVSGDRILIAAGVYQEHELLLDADVDLLGATDAPQDVVIDAQEQGRVLTVLAGGDGATIRGLTFRNGRAQGGDPDGLGGALLVLGASPDVENCRFVFNGADYGGAVYLRGASPAFDHCTFAQNISPTMGGAVFAHDGSSPRLTYCTLYENLTVAGGAFYAAVNCAPLLERCTIVGNFGVFGTAVSGWAGSDITVRSCVIAENGSGYVAQGDVPPQISCTDVYGHEPANWRTPIQHLEGVDGNQSADPLFCQGSGPLSPFQLDGASPCAPTNSPPGCGGVGAWGVGCGDLTPVPTPMATRLHRPHPNPFNPATTLSFELARPGHAQLRIYAVDGRLVATLVDGHLAAGPHEVAWQGRDAGGRRVASGVYFCRLAAGDVTRTQRLTLVK